ncbi:hypothetical protein HPP92_000802 [Vanilla planifolia]|uniref:Uncharacterized protein n=1 Tax=Vanilla planifolia TaxID=51239 RepID=A0A835RX04_VANPL|nr:hypothetical protein HPP92_000802 [Vanilla planifolia]
MGQALSCGQSSMDRGFSAAVQSGELKVVELILQADPGVLRKATFFDRLSPYHIAAAYGHEEMLSMLLDQWYIPDVLTRHKETPLMLAAMQGKVACVEKLLQAGANILKFESRHGRTCLHYAACYGHSDCLQAILQAAYLEPISASWGFARFINTRDAKGLTALHLAAKQGKLACLRLLLDKGALVGSSNSDDGFFGSTPLHLAAQGGSVDCVRELLARGADRNQMDSDGRTPYVIALKEIMYALPC